MRVAIVGVTGMVGEIMRNVLEERNFPITEFLPVASARSVGKTITFQGKDYTVIGLEDAVAQAPDFAMFSAGGQTSLDWAPKFAAVGTTVIDNSSAWRMHPDHKLIVPEINADQLTPDDKIIANPNCSTIQMVMALAPIHKRYGIERVVVSTYQSVTGTGVKAVQQLENEYEGVDGEKAYHHPIHRNALPHCDVFLDNGYTKEEMKLVNETHKILDPNIKVTATAVRIPVVGGHSESVNLTLSEAADLDEVRELLNNTPGLLVIDDVVNNSYPLPLTAEGKDDVFIGRIREDESQEKGLNLWIVADNLRKGAATNTVQISEYLIQQS